MLAPGVWDEQWDVKNTNTSGAAEVLNDLDQVALTYTNSIILGYNVEDDCTPLQASSTGICKLFILVETSIENTNGS